MASMHDARRSSDALRSLMGQLAEATSAFVSNYGPASLSLGDPERLSHGELVKLNDAIEALEVAADALKG